MIKGLSITQPWATLIAIGAKEYETRSWATGYRGQVAIHASKTFPKWARETCEEEPFYSALPALPEFHLGEIIALATIEDCRRTDGVAISPQEAAFGDFAPGRYAWRITNVLPLPEPIACKGALGLWTVPDDIIVQIYLQLAELNREARNA